MRRETKSYPIAGLKAIDTESGEFEAVVSVFGNVDLHGHRIDSKAFDNSIERWQASGDPIPVIFSHQWDDLSSYLGTVDPSGLRALEPGDPDLPAPIKDYGGLFVSGKLDTTEPEGRKAAKLLKSRAVREFSFAYDVLEEETADDGFLDLMELDLIEIGPTLKGANPLTQLVTAKSAEFDKAFAEIAEVFDMKSSEVAELVASVAAIAENRSAGPAQSKAFVTLAGTLERVQEAITRAARAWAEETYGDQLYEVYIEGTYTDRAVIYVETWADPLGGGRYFEAGYEVEGDEVTLGEPAPVEIEATVMPKSRRFGMKEGRRNAGSDLERIQGIHNLTRELGAECETADEDPEGEGSEDDDSGTESRRSLSAASLRTTLDLELSELESDHEG